MIIIFLIIALILAPTITYISGRVVFGSHKAMIRGFKEDSSLCLSQAILTVMFAGVLFIFMIFLYEILSK